MAAPVEIPEGATCWQCGAPADPACTHVRTLTIWSSRHADGQGYPVRRGRRKDIVRVPVPRCARCEVRNGVVAAVIAVATMIGALFGGTAFPSRGWTTIVGALVVLAPLLIANGLYGRYAGLRGIDSYPPIVALRKAGWFEPD